MMHIKDITSYCASLTVVCTVVILSGLSSLSSSVIIWFRIGPKGML